MLSIHYQNNFVFFLLKEPLFGSKKDFNFTGKYK
jgi:hypothetical protein